MSIRPIFAWYDLWIGMFWDGGKHRLYIMPIPCVGVVVQFGGRSCGSAQPSARPSSDADAHIEPSGEDRMQTSSVQSAWDEYFSIKHGGGK